MTFLKKYKGSLHGALTFTLLLITTTLFSLPVFLLGLIKLYPKQKCKIFCTQLVDKVASCWIDLNNFYFDKAHPVRLELTNENHFNPQEWYLVVANHQSWLDIVILQRVLNRKIPVLKFFIKDTLKWMPLLGFAWWAMGCPFMKRYSQEYLVKNPHKKGKDVQATKKALKLHKKSPTTLINFVEGTRYTEGKKKLQNSPYQHLLKPKAGGVGFVIEAMNKQITQLIDVTIVYPHTKNSLWDFLTHKIDSVKVHVRQIPIPSQFLSSNMLKNSTTILEFREWLNQRWMEKDQLITAMSREC